MKLRKIIIPIVLLVMTLTSCQLSQLMQAPATAGIAVPTPGMADANTVPPQPVVVTETVSAKFLAADSGTLCPKRSPDTDLGAPPSVIGEVDDTYTCEGFWSFEYFLPDDSQILSATFLPGNCVVNGDPFAYADLQFAYLYVDSLEINDYGKGGESGDDFKNCPASVDVTADLKGIRVYRDNLFQVRAFFGPGNYGNGIDDNISYGGTQPQLVIEYSHAQ